MGEDAEAIRGSLSRLLMGKRVMLVMTGSISIYKVPDVARGLIRHGAYVSVLMSRTAAKLLGTELEFVIMVIAVSCVKLLSAHNSTQHTSRKHKV
jgi:Phosphopantothenate-cysteine ligase (EC 6.3.2.5)/Phosphopantothenoylcysteine decarboxylase (EC 4.1.1.36)